MTKRKATQSRLSVPMLNLHLLPHTERPLDGTDGTPTGILRKLKPGLHVRSCLSRVMVSRSAGNCESVVFIHL